MDSLSLALNKTFACDYIMFIVITVLSALTLTEY